MTDEANVAPVETGGAVITDSASRTPELGSQIPDEANDTAKARQDAQKVEASKTNQEAVKRAIEASKAKAEEKVKAKEAEGAKTKAEDEKPAQPRDKGKFSKGSEGAKPEDAQRAAPAATGGDQPSEGRKPHHDAPARFLEHSKRDWANVPESVQEDIHRVISENEKGIQKYKTSHERYETFREFDETAKKNGRDLRESIGKLVEFERVLAQNPLAAINFALREAGPRGPDGRPITVDDIVAHVHGQSNDERLQAAQRENQQLRGMIERMKGDQRAAEAAQRIPDEVAAFARENPRLNELGEQIATLIETGLAADLPTAYKLAEMFVPASNAGTSSQPLKPAESVPAQTQAPALNPAGSKSVSGAPAGGVSPTSKQQVPSSNLEAVKRAMARAGA